MLTQLRERLAEIRNTTVIPPRVLTVVEDQQWSAEAVRYAIWLSEVRAEADRIGVPIEIDLLLRTAYAADTGAADAVEEYISEHGL